MASISGLYGTSTPVGKLESLIGPLGLQDLILHNACGDCPFLMYLVGAGWVQEQSASMAHCCHDSGLVRPGPGPFLTFVVVGTLACGGSTSQD